MRTGFHGFFSSIQILGLASEEGINEFLTIENKKIFHFLSDSDVFNGYLELVGNSYYNPSLSCTVKFCKRQSINLGGSSKLFSLFKCILSGAPVKNQ